MDSIEALVEEDIKSIETRMFETLANDLKSIETINDSSLIHDAISDGIASSRSFKHDSTESWNKITGKAVSTSVMTRDLSKVIGKTNTEALSLVIESKEIHDNSYKVPR